MKNSKSSTKKNDAKTKQVKKEPAMKKKILPPKLQAVLNNDEKKKTAEQNALDLHLEKSDVPQTNGGKEMKDAEKKTPEVGTTTATVVKPVEKPKTIQPFKKSGDQKNGDGKGGKNVSKQKTAPVQKVPAKAKGKEEHVRDTKKYIFEGKKYGKGPFVLAVIKHYIAKRKPTITELKTVFPDELITRYCVFTDLKTALEKSKDKKRYFIKEDQIFVVGGKKYAVTNQITAQVMVKFLDHLKKRGLKMK